MRTYDELQDAVAAWQRRNFGDSPTWHLVCGIAEEVGEYHHAMTPPEQRDAIGDVGVYSLALCGHMGWRYTDTLGLASEPRWPGRHVSSYVGDMCRAVLKRDQRIRGYEQDATFRGHLWRALVGVTWYTVHWNLAHGTSTHLGLLNEVADRVLQRDWVKNPGDAHKVAEPDDPIRLATWEGEGGQ